MRLWSFAKRTALEILRDPLNLAFGLGFPLVLLVLLSAIQSSIPVELFVIDRLTPGISVFGLSFMSLFSATLIAKDRKSSLLKRLYATPMTSLDFLFGYTLPILPIALAQSVVCYLAAMLMGLEPTVHMLTALILILPVSLLYLALGLLCGSVLTDKQVGGICGALLTNLSAWLSGIWFDLDLVGGVFKKIAYLLPFVHAVELEQAALRGSYGEILPHLLWVLGYAVLLMALAVAVFLRQMKKQ